MTQVFYSRVWRASDVLYSTDSDPTASFYS